MHCEIAGINVRGPSTFAACLYKFCCEQSSKWISSSFPGIITVEGIIDNQENTSKVSYFLALFHQELFSTKYEVPLTIF